MKKLLLAATMLAGITFNATAAETIRFAASATYPPFESLDANNQIVGFDIDLANALCKQMQAQCTFTNQAFDSPDRRAEIQEIRCGDFRYGHHAGAQQTGRFHPALLRQLGDRDRAKGKFSSLADLKGKKLGMENGTTHQKYMQDKHPEINTVSYDSYQNAILELKNGRIDGVFGDTAVVNEWLKTNPQLAPVGEHITDAQYFGTGLGIAVRPDNQALLAKLNAALDAIKADGTYKAINDKWFPQ